MKDIEDLPFQLEPKVGWSGEVQVVNKNNIYALMSQGRRNRPEVINPYYTLQPETSGFKRGRWYI